jgi:sulfhydrogenase subunit alpha
MKDVRTIRVKALTRVEGEGGLRIVLRDGAVEQVELKIFEPPRFFEALLRGRPLEEVPDITARICGICPVAYQMSAVHAIERALRIRVPPPLATLRRLLYCGEWIESHALHVHLLNAPDFLGYESGLAMAKDHPDILQRGLRLKKHGNQLLEVLGGRAVHPVNVAVGGFYRLPRAEELACLIPDFQWGLQAAIEATRWVASFDFPQLDRPYDFVAVSHDDQYAMCEGTIRSSDGLAIDASDFEQFFREQQVPYSTALQAVRTDTGRTYFLGPLARVNLNRQQLMPSASRLADEVGLEQPCRNPFKSIVARGIELVQAYEEALTIMADYRPTALPRVKYDYGRGEGAAATEAPRGLLYHRYAIDDQGQVTSANIIPPTSQNQSQIEEDLRSYLPLILSQPDDLVAMACERLVRSYDPCISCSTHFLKVTLERQS